MITNLQPYQNLQDSDIEWMVRIPRHWKTGTIKSLAHRGYKTFSDGDWIESPYITSDGIRLVQTGNIGVRVYREKGFRYISEETFLQLNCTEVHPGDVLICRLGDPVARACIAPNLGKRMVTSVDVCILKPRKGVHSKFLVYTMSSQTYLDWVASLVRGSTRDRVSRSMIGAFSLPLPPLPEQATIVRFLDHADRCIRRYIRAKKKLIALLQEQKQAIIHQAVTGRIDVHTSQPYRAYKPSGVEWLQEAPAHWEIVALRRRWRVIDCKHLTVPFVDGGIPLASVREAQSFELSLQTSNRTTPEWYEQLIEGGREPRRGDLIYCRNVSVGAAALVATEDRFAMGQDVCLIRSSSENQRWLNYFLQSKVMSDQLALILVGSTFNRINVADIKALLIAVPPVSEQDRIAAVLDDELSKIDVAIDICRREQALLHEYRTRLIADVVTGNLDVRGAATELPEDDGPGDAEEPADEYTIEPEVTV